MDTGKINATEDEALRFHADGRPGKLSIAPHKPLDTQRDLSLAYSPGVAYPVPAHPEGPVEPPSTTPRRAISSRSSRTAPRCWASAISARSPPSRSWKARRRCSSASPISTRSISRSTPRMSTSSSIACASCIPRSAASISRTSRAPECFVIEERLRELLDIPVFHDDQHGTAIIATAGLINALHLTKRELERHQDGGQRRRRGLDRLRRAVEDDGAAERQRRAVRHARASSIAAAPRA